MSVFEELVDKIQKYEIASFKNWVYSLTKNYCLMKLRKSKQFEGFVKHNVQSQKEKIMETLNEMHPLIEIDYNEKKKILKEGLSSLNKEQELCITLFYLEEKSYREVEEMTGFSANQVKSYIQNGKRNLKLYLESNGSK
jgi:RNA polymerase sigma factor (sigma-70 family)